MESPGGFLFDYGGTVVEEPPFDPLAGTHALLAVARETGGATAEEIQDEAERFVLEHWPTVERTAIEISTSSFRRLIYERFGVVFDRSDEELDLLFWKASIARSIPTPGIERLLDTIAVPKAILSNNSFPGHVVRWELEQCGLLGSFDFVMSSSDYGLRKPHKELFKTAARKLGVDPGGIWVCGDRLDTDIRGARASGMTAVWYSPEGRDPASPRPDLIVRHWDELRETVARLSGD